MLLKNQRIEGKSMQKRKPIALIVIIAMLPILVTGCGKKKIDVMDTVDLQFSGVNGHGTAILKDAYDWESQAMEAAGIEIKDFYSLGEAFFLENAVAYEISPSEALSNGDEVEVKAIIDDKVANEYNIKFVGGTKKFVVDGLKEVEYVDLFENIDVDFQGIAPDATAILNNANSDYYVGVKRYTLDKTSNLRVGDIVTVTAEYDESKMLEAGYMAKQDTKEFVVPEIDRYVMSIEEIPEETINKMNKQLEDAIYAQVANKWSEKDSLVSAEYVGCYLLTAKENMPVFDHNVFYSIYKLEVKNSENEFSFYTYCSFNNIIILKDGTCSVDLASYKMPQGSAFFGSTSGEAFMKGSYYYTGYEEIDSLFSNCVTKNIEYYEYETKMNE